MSLRTLFPADRNVGIPAAAFLSFALLLPAANPAHALSELQPATPPAQEEPAEDETLEDEPPVLPPQSGPDGGLPAPRPLIRHDETPQTPGDTATGQPEASAPLVPAPEIITDLAQLPEPVARMRQLIMEAAATGDPERLRSLLGSGPTATRLALNAIDSDPVDYLKSISGDAGGQEILAIMLDILEAGFVRVDEGLGTGEAGDLYVWPYFAAMPIEELTAAQQVDLLRIVTAGDFADMLAYGGYNFYRIAITPDGQWRYFMTSD